MDVRRQYATVGVVRKESKAVEAAECAQIWGAVIDGKGKCVSASVGRRALLVRASITICQRRVICPGDLRCVVGHWNHQLAFRRCGTWETDLRTPPCRVLTASDATTKRGASVFASMTGGQALWCYNRSDKPASKLFYKGLVEQSKTHLRFSTRLHPIWLSNTSWQV
eukprot:3810165-Amphidinium_carterae.1